MADLPTLNADDLARLTPAITDLDRIGRDVGLHGSLMVDLDGRHVGYLVVKTENETVFTQRAPS